MTSLHYTETLVNITSYYDLEAFINAYYGIGHYSFCADQNPHSDSMHMFHVKKQDIDSYDLGKLETFKNKGETSYITSTILADLCNNDALMPGKYLIDVSW